MKILFAILFAVLSINSFGQNSLIGKWRRISQTMKQVSNDSSQVQTGDLTFYPDSTFFIQGDTSIAGLSVPGWHVGEEYKGVWRLTDKNHLILRQNNTLFLNFSIMELTTKNLVLISRFYRKNNKRFYIRYMRI